MHLSRSQRAKCGEKAAFLRVHQVVAHTFLPGYDANDTNVVDHRDANRQNNSVANLRFVNTRFNTIYAGGVKTKVEIGEHENDDYYKEEAFDSLSLIQEKYAYDGLKKLERKHFDKTGRFQRFATTKKEGKRVHHTITRSMGEETTITHK